MSDGLKVCFVAPDGADFADRYSPLASELVAAGTDVSVISADASSAIGIEGVTESRVPFAVGGSRLAREAVLLPLLVARIHALRPAVVHVTDIVAAPSALIAARIAEVPVRFGTATRPLDGLDAPSPGLVARAARKLPSTALRVSAASAHRVIAMHSGAAHSWLASGLVASDHLRTLDAGLGVDLDALATFQRRDIAAARARLGLAAEGALIVTIVDGHDPSALRAIGHLAAALAVRAPTARLVLGLCVGAPSKSAPRGNAVISRAVRDPQARRDLIAAADVVVQLERSVEQATAIMEAMVLRVPVVASDVLGHQELLCGGDNGLLVEAGSASAALEASLALADDEPRRAMICARARAHAVRSFGSDRALEQVASVYAELLGGEAERLHVTGDGSLLGESAAARRRRELLRES